MDHATAGTKALDAFDYPAATRHFTEALLVHPHAPDHWIKRSIALSRNKQGDVEASKLHALDDIELALAIAAERGRRETVITAQVRRGVVYYMLKRYADAKFVFDIARSKIGPDQVTMEHDKLKSRELPLWEVKVAQKLNEKGVDQTVRIKEYPQIKVPDQVFLKEELKKQLASGDFGSVLNVKPTQAQPKQEIASSSPTSEASATSTQSPPTGPVSGTLRHEWYQRNDAVVVTLYAKGVPKDQAQIDIQPDSLHISFPVASGRDYFFDLNLSHAVDPSKSQAKVMSTKIEVVLGKTSPGKWTTLEQAAVPQSSFQAKTNAQSAVSSSDTSAAIPSYPTSSRAGPKNWDKVAADLTKKPKKTETSNSSESPSSEKDSDDDGYDSDFGGDPVDSFFKKLYAGSDPDTRRAMMKSYYESNGTALSTNWSEVGKGKVEPKEPSDY